MLGACTDSEDNLPAERPELRVTDSHAIGAVGDDALSLVEALQIAGGLLAVAELSSAERLLISGTPGPESADTIRVALANGDRIEAPSQTIPDGPEWFPLFPSSSLPDIVGNEGDVLEGAGYTFSNGPADGPLGGLGLVIRSSDFTIQNLVFERFAEMLSISPSDESGLQGITIRGNSFLNGGGLGLGATAANGSRSLLRGVRISNNEFLGPSEFGGRFPRNIHSAIGGVATPLSAPPDEQANRLENLTISGNRIRGYFGAVQLMALQSFTGNSNGVMRNIRIIGNDITIPNYAGDPAIYIWGAVTLGGMSSNALIESLEIADNEIAGSGYVVLVTGVENVSGQNLLSENHVIRDVSIHGNTIRPVNDCGIGILVMSSFTEMSSGSALDNRVEALDISANEIHDCELGILVTPMLNWGAAGASMGNSMENVTIIENSITGARTGIIASGGTILANELGLEDSPEATVAGNYLRGLEISRNSLGSTQEGFALYGGAAIEAPGSVTQNELVAARALSNTVPADIPLCTAAANGIVRSDATVEANTLDANEIDCSR